MKKTKFSRIAALSICGVLLSSCAAAPQGNDSVAEAPSAEMVGSENAVEIQQTEELAFSHQSGFYDEDITLEMVSRDVNAKIYYTTDGSEPDETDTLYESPIVLTNRSSAPNILSEATGTSAGGDYIPRKRVDKANVIRAVAVYPDGTKSGIVNRTYWVGIDREKKYGSVPVISLMTDTANLYGYEQGIYILGKTYDDWVAEQDGYYESWEAEGNYSKRGREWERPIAVELIEADGDVGFSQDMGVRIMGAASRSATQKSLRLTAREEYGKKSLEYELIPDAQRSDGNGTVTKYKSFVLRNGGNDCDFGKVRDPLLQSLVTHRDFETMAYAPCVVYLDGEYWGMYTIVEDYSDNYIENNYGIDNKNAVIIKRGELEEGEENDTLLYNEMFDFITSNDMTAADNYNKACEYIDMQSYIEYCAMQFYIYNEDSIFHDNNWRMWRVREADETVENADGKWRMMVYDTDFSSGIYCGGNNYSEDNISECLVPQKRKEKEDDNEDGEETIHRHPADMFCALYNNEEFRQQLIVTMCDMRNIDFEGNAAIDELVRMSEDYIRLVPSTFDRFGPEWVARQDTKKYYEQKINELANYLDGRYRVYPELMQEIFGLSDIATAEIKTDDRGAVYVNSTAKGITDNFKGKYFTDYPITVTAAANDGSTFKGWKYSGCTLSDENAETTVVTFAGDFSLEPIFE